MSTIPSDIPTSSDTVHNDQLGSERTAGVTRRRSSSSEGPENMPGASGRQAVDDASLRSTGRPPTKRARESSPESSWPARGVFTNDTADGVRNRQRPARAALSTEGRDLPPLTPQAVGQYFRQPIGTWPKTRDKLTEAVASNLEKLGTLRNNDEVRQLKREITLHFHSLSPAEQSDMLDRVGRQQMGKKQNVTDWLEFTAAHLGADMTGKLVAACTDKARAGLAKFEVAGTNPERSAQVKEANKNGMRMELPADHLYDYAGFLLGNKMKVAYDLPAEAVQNTHVGIVGGGPAGLIAAHLLNHLGIKVTVFEATDRIGGRLATNQRIREDGTESPTPQHGGGMRLHTSEGNAFWRVFCEGFPVVPFPNPSRVGATLLLGNEIAKYEPGKDPEHPVLKKVYDDVTGAMDALTKPMREARDAGDTARFRELYDDARKKFDSCTYYEGVKVLLDERGIKWSDEQWKMFGAVGQGVGGYKGYSEVGFLEELRFLVDERLEGHQMIVDGIDAPLKAMIHDTAGLPEGGQSLHEQDAIKYNARVTDVSLVDGQYRVSVEGQEEAASFSKLLFAAGPRIAEDIGLTREPKEGEERILPEEVSTWVKAADMAGATKMSMTVPAEDFHPDMLPKNIQSTEPFQQLYVQAPTKDGNSAVIYLSYTLGSNAKAVEGKTKDQQIDGLLQSLRNAANANPGNEEAGKLNNLADLIDRYRGRSSYVHWSEVDTQKGAFKMDAPYKMENTRNLYRQTIDGNGKGLYMIGEEFTNEGGFASGAVSGATNGVQGIAAELGGKLQPNSPHDQALI